MLERKYEFTGPRVVFNGHTLRRVRYLRDVGSIKEGSVGGWIEGEHNLSHEGNCVVTGNAKAFGETSVVDDAILGGDSILKDNALLRDNAQVLGFSYICDKAIIGADTIIFTGHISGESKIFFYADENYGRRNISESDIEDCTIEATGSIEDSWVGNEKLQGVLEIVDKNGSAWD